MDAMPGHNSVTADELRQFADLVEKGFVYRGKKPVYWSVPFRTALAEAEVEYADHVSQSVFVRLRLAGEPGLKAGPRAGAPGLSTGNGSCAIGL